MTADEIRAIAETVPQFVILREIAAQLAEHNEREHRIEKRMAIKFARMPDPKAPEGAKPGDVVKLEGGIFLEVCFCGLMHEGDQEDLRERYERQQKRPPARR